jgi:hypothetical protein
MGVQDWKKRLSGRHAKVAELPTIAMRAHGRLDPPADQMTLVCAEVGPADEMIALWSTSEGHDVLRSRTVQEGRASFPDSRTSRSVELHVSSHAPALISSVTLEDRSIAHPHVQPMPDGGFLLVGARCRWSKEGAEHNAVVYDRHGAVIRTGVLGDGIEHVQTTPSGQIWVAYFDEGVYGNYGWGSNGAPQPVGHPGLIRFDSNLEVVWEHPYDTDHGSISDCYALNVDGETAWACYYTDFPIICVTAGAVSGWRNEVAGARALAVNDQQVALVGGYSGERDRAVVGSLGEGTFEVERELRLTMPDGGELPPSARSFGRGSELHVLAESTWLRLGLDELLTR